VPDIPSGTIIGYHAETGEKLFEHTNRATRDPSGKTTIPSAGEHYQTGGKYYLIVGIRKGSAETLCLMDVLPRG